MELANAMWKCVITAMSSIASVVICGRNNSSPQHKTMSVTASLASSCMMYTSVKKSSTSVMLKLCNSQTLWWVFCQTKESSRLNTLHRTSAQQRCVSYTVLHSVTSSASKSHWTSRRLLKSDFVSQGKEEIYPFIWEFISDQK